MPNPNISAVLSPADKAMMKNNVDANKAILVVFGVNLTPERRQAITKTGARSVGFVQDCLKVVKLHSEAIPGGMIVTEFEKDVTFFVDLNELNLHHAPYVEMISDTKMAVGSEVIKQANRIYATVKELAKNDAAFDAIFKQLSKRYRESRKPRRKFINHNVMLSPAASISMGNVVEKSDFTNNGTTALMLCSGQMAECTNGTRVEPGSTVKIPKGVTTITVTNLNGTANGSFIVKIEG